MIPFRKIDLFEDAIFYRDVTQWLRQKRIHILLVGLMVLGLCCVLLPGLVSNISDVEGVGLASISMLGSIYILYSLLLLSNTGYSIFTEFSTNTYELYEVTGLTPEEMMRGRMLSASMFLLIGLTVLMPYGVVSWMLGGVDFTLLLFLFAAALLAIPGGTVVIIALAYSMRFAGGAMMRPLPLIILIVFGLMVLPNLLFLPFMFLPMMFSGSSGASFNPVGDIVTEFLDAPVLFMLSATLLMVLYFGSFMLVFYHGVHKLCRPCDTRSYQIRFWFSFCAVAWMLLFGLASPMFDAGGVTGEYAIAAYLPMGCAIVLLLVATLFGRTHPPKAFAFRYRYNDGEFEGMRGLSAFKSRWQRWSLNHFGPAQSTTKPQMHLMLGVTIGAIGLGMLVNTLVEMFIPGSYDLLGFFEMFDIISLLVFYCLFVPLFPAGLFQNPRVQKKSGGNKMAFMLLMWILLVALLGGGWTLIGFDYVSENSFSPIYYMVVEFTAIFFPSSVEDLGVTRLFLPVVSTIIRFGLGGLGYVMLNKWLEAEAIRDKMKKAPPPLPPAEVGKKTAPPPLPVEPSERSS
jgi:hypothetical protein